MTSILAIPAVDLPATPRGPGRPRRRVDSPHLGLPPGREAGGDLPSVLLHPRRRLDDDMLTAAEAIMPRNAVRSGLLLDPHGALLRQIASLGAPWHGAVISLGQGVAFDATQIIGQVAWALEVADLPATRMELILSEASLATIDTDGVLALSALRDLGIGLCVDAFGAGMASLTLLRRLPLTSLKLARTLVRAVPDDREDAAVLRAVIGTAQAVGLTVIGDGIDTERQRAFLAHCGCDEGQGALFGPPLQVVGLPRQGILA